MIVRKLEDAFLVIRQHDHGKISGEFARHWDAEIVPEAPTLHAIAEHDIGWRELDAEVRFNPDTNAPYSFMNYPLEPKLRAYGNGLDLVEAEEPYAGYLCSMHYSSFIQGAEESPAVEFKNDENKRRIRLEEHLPEKWLDNAEYNFRLLQLCDDLSLFVCLNEPGENAVPWYKNGFRFMGENIVPIWRDEHTLSLNPDPFSVQFDLAIPYRLIERSGRVIESDNFHLRVAC